MKVRELIENLEDFDPDMTVIIEVGGDGAIHSSDPTYLYVEDGKLLISSEAP